ncbi:hypothetical protein [Rickettsia bellii]|nr:hypothetical protein [Rickettsia bellii]
MSEEEFKKRPNMAKYPEEEKIFFYIIEIGHYENYDDAMDYMAKNLKASEEFRQIAASQALQILVHRFYNIKDELILPLLFKHLKSDSKYKYFLSEIMNTLGDIAHLVPRLRRKIYLTCFNNDIDFVTYKKLKKFTDKNLLYSLNNEEEKIEFILSFCQNSSSYQEALEVCLYFLRKNESEKINIAAFQGLTYIVFRFRKINFKAILPFIGRFSRYSTERCEWIYTESLLEDIAIVIPKLRIKAITFLKKYSYSHLRTSSFINYIITKNKPKDQIKLEKILKLNVNNLKKVKLKYNLNF